MIISALGPGEPRLAKVIILLLRGDFYPGTLCTQTLVVLHPNALMDVVTVESLTRLVHTDPDRVLRWCAL